MGKIPEFTDAGLPSGARDEYGNELEFPSAFRRSRRDGRPRGIVKIRPGSDQGYTSPLGLRAWQERMPLSYRRLRTTCPGQAQPRVFPAAK